MNTRALLVGTAVLFLFSCSADIEIPHPDPLFPEQSPFKATLFIRIMDEYGRPVPGARVHIGPFVKESDYHGWIQWRDANVTMSTFIKVEKDGYFLTSRRIYPSGTAPNYVKFLLLPKIKTVSFSSASGNVVWIERNFALNFPKDGYQLENGKSYAGQVNVFIQPLSIDDPDMSFKMPGDLTGINTENKLGKLASMGMIGVEMQTATGEKLKLADGHQVEIKFPVTDDRLTIAPASLPMWYYDEEVGVWREEGSAELIGNQYVTQVSHFSFWNCDAYFQLIHLDASFQTQQGIPLAYGTICLTIDALNAKVCSYLDQDGKVSGGIAANEILTMQVYADCGQEVYTGKIGPFSQDVVIGPTQVEDPTYISHLEGTVYDCDSERATTGYVLINSADQLYQVPLDSSGSFSMDISDCPKNFITLQVFNEYNLVISTLQSVPVAPVIVIDSIKACLKHEEYFMLDAEGLSYPIVVTPHSIWGALYDDCRLYVGFENASCLFDLCLKNVRDGNFPNTHCQLETQLHTIADTLTTVWTDHMDLKIENFGKPGGMLKGKFAGEFQMAYGNNVTYQYLPFKGEFNVRIE